MSDIHDKKDLRKIAIKNVGICDYYAPFILKNMGEEYITTAEIKSGISLEAYTKGAHLSRINMVLNEELVNKALSISDIEKIVKKISKEVEADNANLEMNFKIAFNFKTPKSELNTNMYSDIKLYIRSEKDKISEEYITVCANAAMLCPNSKAKSRYGAHSQKCIMKATLYDNISKIDLRQIYTILCNSGSAPVFDIVRSSDEAYMTELAYDNPKFSEDAIRDTIIALKKKYNNNRICVELKNLESIHQHNVYCVGEQ